MRRNEQLVTLYFFKIKNFFNGQQQMTSFTFTTTTTTTTTATVLVPLRAAQCARSASVFIRPLQCSDGIALLRVIIHSNSRIGIVLSELWCFNSHHPLV